MERRASLIQGWEKKVVIIVIMREYDAVEESVTL